MLIHSSQSSYNYYNVLTTINKQQRVFFALGFASLATHSPLHLLAGASKVPTQPEKDCRHHSGLRLASPPSIICILSALLWVKIQFIVLLQEIFSLKRNYI